MNAPLNEPTSNLRLTVFGATGGTGRATVQAALDAGHEVTAFVRDPDRMALVHDRLELVQGDVFDAEATRRAVRGQDAVICCLGAPPSNRDRIRERGTAAIVQAMEAEGVTRLVVQSSHGIGETAPELPWVMRWFIVPFYLKHAFADHEGQEAVVRDSSLAWTLVRPPHLSDAAPTGEPVVAEQFDPSRMAMKVSRGDVARFMVDEAAEGSWVGKVATVSV